MSLDGMLTRGHVGGAELAESWSAIRVELGERKITVRGQCRATCAEHKFHAKQGMTKFAPTLEFLGGRVLRVTHERIEPLTEGAASSMVVH